MSNTTMDHVWDTVILGGGPAGYTAAMYATRAGLSTLVLEKFSAGGQMTQTQQIDNYPGFSEGVDGFTLGFKMQEGAERFGAQTKQTEVLSVVLDVSPKRVTTDAGDVLARTVIIATGADHKHLGVEYESELIGRGIGYCAACDGMLFRGKTVAVVGGGNSAAADALLLSKICGKVYLIHRRDTLRATKIYHEPLMQAENIEFVWNSRVDELLFEQRLQGVRVCDVNDGTERDIALDGLFISIGRSPETAFLQGQLALDEQGYIVADESTCTSVPGVFAAGDVRAKTLRQIVTAAADGAVAAHMAEQYLATHS
ncbi:MAG: thioredoxin-disulfide reductase [Clostridia bacterium]|nr:thioredoxin-disulfide reductase [Clostridia bacterium]